MVLNIVQDARRLSVLATAVAAMAIAACSSSTAPAGDKQDSVSPRTAAQLASGPTGTSGEASVNAPAVASQPKPEENTPEQVLAALGKLNLGTDGGRQVVVTPAEYACGQQIEDPLTIVWLPDVEQADCHGTRKGRGRIWVLRWLEQKPAKYGPDPEHGPAQDSEALLEAARLLRKLSTMKPDAKTSDLEQGLQKVAEVETSLAATSKELSEAEEELADKKDVRKDYTYIRAFMIADHGDNTYEISPPYGGTHALLKTMDTTFTTQGRFGLWVSKEDDEDVTTTNGFHQSWHVYSEIDKDEVKDLDKEISELSKKVASDKKAVQTLTKTFGPARESVGIALRRFLAGGDAQPGSLEAVASTAILVAKHEKVTPGRPSTSDAPAGSAGSNVDAVVDVSGRSAVVTGALSREEIERVIKRHEQEILYCYKTELNKEPTLAGKMAVNLTIDGSGSISNAQVVQSTLNNNNVEQCMLGRFRRWKFPEPAGGGIVQVTYPVRFGPTPK